MSTQTIQVSCEELARIIEDTNNDLAQLAIRFAAEVDQAHNDLRNMANAWKLKAEELHALARSNEAWLEAQMSLTAGFYAETPLLREGYKLALHDLQSAILKAPPL